MIKLETIIILLFAPIILFMLYTLFIWIPVDLNTQSKCLTQGYPEHRTSIGLEQYCMNLDGSITVRVKPTNELRHE